MGQLLKLQIFAVILVLISNVDAREYFYDFPGPYCETRPGGCCDSRKDVCAVPISSK